MRLIARRRHEVVDQQPLDPEDDPYAAYLIWKAEREAESGEPDTELDGADGAVSAAASAAAIESTEPARGSWFRRISALGHVNAARGR
ncbi:hypothetical protein [Agromyces bracchium]|uniref:Uncharacterized protein n=1 Tax=Agromyces bracchium TaxID=88376 RepID=A0A6I3M642_9MICO|nr:hypothetical protein [Agromyces bracchium]MTH66806.1 hypothetical protein [Agromyces bracchium]